MDLERLEEVLTQIAQLYLNLLEEVQTLKAKEGAIQDSYQRLEGRLRETIEEKTKIIKKLRNGGPRGVHSPHP